jgi:hypothetical protein
MFFSKMIRAFALMALVVPMVMAPSNRDLNNSKQTRNKKSDAPYSARALSLGCFAAAGVLSIPFFYYSGTGTKLWHSLSNISLPSMGSAMYQSVSNIEPHQACGIAAYVLTLVGAHYHGKYKDQQREHRYLGEGSTFKAKKMDDAREAQLANELAFLKDDKATRMPLN